jgi:hypothetical protein
MAAFDQIQPVSSPAKLPHLQTSILAQTIALQLDSEICNNGHHHPPPPGKSNLDGVFQKCAMI